MKYKYIYYNKNDYFIYRRFYKKQTITKSFKNKIDCLCYKFIQELKLKCGIYKFNKSVVSFWKFPERV